MSQKAKPMIAAELVDGLEPPRHPPVGLNTLEGIRVEMSRIYRDGKEGRRRTEDASRLTWMLSQVKLVVEAIDEVEQEDRIRAIENRLGLADLIALSSRTKPAPAAPLPAESLPDVPPSTREQGS